MKDSNSVVNQEIKNSFVGREVLACFSYEMQSVLNAEGTRSKEYPLPTYEDIENAYEDICPKCGSSDIYKSPDQNVPNSDCFQCGSCDVVLPNDELESQPKEIFEWWIVTEYLYKALKARGQAVLAWGNNYYWGRETTGQAILLDGIISSICEEMEILNGQKYSWAKR